MNFMNWNTYHWVPFLNGKYLTYTEYFALVLCSLMTLISIICFSIFLLIKIFRKRSLRIGYQQTSQITSQPLIEQYQIQSFSIIQTIKHVFYISGFFFLSLNFPILSGLGIIQIYYSIAGMFATLFLLIMSLRIMKFIQQNQRLVIYYTFLNKIRYSFLYGKPVVLKLLFVLLISLLIPALTYGICIDFYNYDIFYYNQHFGFGFNTYFSRYLYLQNECQKQEPCHIYTTVPEDASTALFVNVQTSVSVTALNINYKKLNDTIINKVDAVLFQYKILQYLGQRNIHSALITDLQPNSIYQFNIVYNGKVQATKIYKTLPDDQKTKFSMVNAGDVGFTDQSKIMSAKVGQLKPDLLIIGGDIAYDDNMPSCYYTWDRFFYLYQKICERIGNLIPLVLAVGNHDLGLNQLPRFNLTVNEQGPAYHIYFPQHYDYDSQGNVIKKVPPISKRKTFFYHLFGQILYVTLDSGYLHTFGGQQQLFLKNILNQYPSKIKMVNYHVPMYKSCKNIYVDAKFSIDAMYHWLPLFDTYKVMSVFENHVHTFKRTYPLRSNGKSENGTVYMGDGCFGAIIRQCQTDETIDIFEKTGSFANFWISQINAEQVIHRSYDQQCMIIDEFSQQISRYKKQQ